MSERQIIAVEVNIETYKKLANYLQQMPYSQVAQLMAELSQSKPVYEQVTDEQEASIKPLKKSADGKK